MDSSSVVNSPSSSASSQPAVIVGCVVEFQGFQGTVRYVGKTQFATGSWVGIELESKDGKNDGSVNGERYFQCLEGFGVFCRQSQIKNVISYPASSTSKVAAADRRQTLAGSSSASAKSRLSSVGLTGRPSLAASRTAGGVSTRSANARLSLAARPPIAPKSDIKQEITVEEPAPSPIMEPVSKEPEVVERRQSISITSPPPPQTPMTPSSFRSVSIKEHEELKVRVKLLESKRAEDREKLRDYERIKADLEKLELMKSKSGSKLEDMQNEVVSLRKQVKEGHLALEEMKGRYQDVVDSLEMITLDKEVAEEKAETLQLEVDTLKEQVEELSLNIEVLEEERQSGSGDGEQADGKVSSVENAQLEKQNERLKEALIKLRDVSTTREADMEKRIKVLEKEQTHLHEIQAKNEELKSKLSVVEENLEIVKQQLDDALENNDLVELLTVKNLKLSETVEEQKEALADLEALRDLNEELEENHQETEGELMEEIELQESEIKELKSEIEKLNESNAEYGNTVLQFRELVKNLQSDIQRLKGHSEGEKEEVLASQTQQMLELNMKLQNTAMKNTANAIELELRKMESHQTLEELEVVKRFVPKLFFEVDASALKSYFSIYRLSFKSELILRFIEDNLRHSASESPDEIYTMNLIKFKACQIVYNCNKIMCYSRRCRKEDYVLLHHYVQDLTLAESKMDELIASLKSEELRSNDHLTAIKRIVSQLNYIAEKLIRDDSVIMADQLGAYCGRVLDVTAQVVISGSLQMSQVYSHSKDDSLQLEIEKMYSTGFHDDINQLLVESRMICKKLETRLSELTDTEVLQPVQLVELEKLMETFDKFASMYQVMYDNFAQYLKSRDDPTLADLIGIVESVLEDHFGAANAKIGLSSIKTHLLAVNESLNAFYERSLNASQSCMKIPSKFIEAWTLRAKEILDNCQNNPELERLYGEAQHEIKKLGSEIKTKEESYNQAHIKVQILEKRIDALRQQSSVVDHYEVELKKMKEQEKTFMEAIESMQTEIDRLEAELKQAVEKQKQQYDSNSPEDYNISDSRIAALYSALRLLRSENSQLRAKRSHAILESLKEDDHIFKKYLQSKSTPANVKDIVQESKSIMKQVQLAAASIQLVDLSKTLVSKPNQWKPISTRPEYQYHSQQTVINTIKHRSMVLETKIKSLQLHIHHKPISAKEKKLVARVRVNDDNKQGVTCRSVLLRSVPEFKQIHQRIIRN